MSPVMVRICAALAAATLALAGCGDDEQPRTPAPAPASDEAVLWAIGDAATPGTGPRRLARYVAGTRFTRLLYLGDVYETGTRDEFESLYEPLYGRVARRTLPVIGNHEDANRDTGYFPYWRRKLGRPLSAYYSERVAGWEIIALDSESPLAPQLRWLRDELREPTNCRMVILHRPRYSAGSEHGDQEDLQPVWRLLRGQAVAVLSGHEHNLQRFDPVDGIVQFISGSGGRALYETNGDDDRLAFANDTRFGGLRIRLRRDVAGYEFVADDGEVLDRGELRCAPG